MYKEILKLIKTNKGTHCQLNKTMSNSYFILHKHDTCNYILTPDKIIFYKEIEHLETTIILTVKIYKNTKLEKYIYDYKG